jgi:3-dehydroquinate synthase
MREHVIEQDGAVVSRITVGRGIDESILRAVAGRGPRNVAVLCQPTTFPLADRYASLCASAGLSATGYSLPDGEMAKQMGVVEDVYRHLNGLSFTRGDVIVAVGGGALTDVAGFVAATYLRGVPAIYVPTTLLGAVDAAIGGKTAVNVDGKNLAGVFRHPEAVFVDIDTLDALDRRHKVEGAAEALKAGFIADMGIVDAYEAHGLDVDLEEIVDRSIAVKVAVVNDDFTERDRRAILNYGHTVGHAIETSTGRSHGASVAIGMVAAGAASAHRLGFGGEARQRDVLGAVGLPTSAPDGRKELVAALMALDKKRDGAGLRMVLLSDFEAPELVHTDDATVRAALDAIGLA